MKVLIVDSGFGHYRDFLTLERQQQLLNNGIEVVFQNFEDSGEIKGWNGQITVIDELIRIGPYPCLTEEKEVVTIKPRNKKPYYRKGERW